MKKYSIKQIKKTNLKDTFLGTYFYRKLSTYFTFFIAMTPLTPNHISVISMIVGLAGCYFFALGTFNGYLLGNILLQTGMILDYSDGQVARLKKLGSSRGAWLDVVLGMIQNNIFVLCLMIGLYVQSHLLIPLIIGFIVLFAWNMTCYVHLNAMIFFPALTLKETAFAGKVKKRFFIKPQYLSIGSDVYFIVLGVGSLIGFLFPALIFMAVLGNLYWIAVGAFMFLSNPKNLENKK